MTDTVKDGVLSKVEMVDELARVVGEAVRFMVRKILRSTAPLSQQERELLYYIVPLLQQRRTSLDDAIWTLETATERA